MEIPYIESVSPLPESQSLHHTLEFICIQKIPIELSVVFSPYSLWGHSQLGN